MGGPILTNSTNSSKLGYQRTSIACANCRRRKIRCVISEADANRHQKCSNCIRLKKDCVFYPVDQQAAMEGKSPASSKAAGSEADSKMSASVSPSRSSSGHQDHSTTPLSSNTNSSHHVNALPGIPIEPHDLAGYHGFPSPAETRQSWSSTGEMSPSLMGTTIGSHEPYWHHPESIGVTDYAPMQDDYTAQLSYTQQQQLQQQQQQRQELWQLQQRSMSFGHVENMPSHGAPYFAQAQQAPSRYSAPSSLNLQRAAHMNLGPGPQSVPVAPYYNQYALQSGQTSQMNAPLPTNTTYNAQTGWYHENPTYEPVDDALSHIPMTTHSYEGS
ncbi:Hypothetical protein R9X50_00054900 [Acrodontium crateriforme]|uniref:Zn(2)-C6 fungal-type domain-containing protein n=1 Tax=Acrodontium crateriforme TaxID=150365 RepID=A0AAQ3LXH5_9PEZI|nr:Hypothetical protein R9X50_00054900 [Acrodontium crateriforme]